MTSSGFEFRFTSQAVKDIGNLTPKLRTKLRSILEHLLRSDPYAGKKLVGELAGNYSYRLNRKDRIIYSIDEKHRIIYIKRAKTHYGD